MIRRFIAWIRDMSFPPRCPFCGELSGKEGQYCVECREGLPVCHVYTVTPNAKRPELFCLRAPYYYTGPARRAAKSLKFDNHRSAAVHFARAMADMEQVSGLAQAEFVTAVPLSRQRLRHRGFNQSELIARQYALFKGMTYLETLEKHKDTPKQSLQISAKARAANVKGCYRVLNADMVKNKTVVLIDDVYTTGATMRECAKMLRQAGARCVIGLAGCTSGKKKKHA